MYRVFLILIVALLAASCAPQQAVPAVADGQILAAQARTALWGIKQVVDGAAGTFIMQKGDQFILFWGKDGGMFFVVVDGAKQTAIESLQSVVDCGGNYANCKTFSELFNNLLKNGWATVTTAALPKAFFSTVSRAPAAWLMNLANSMPTFVLAPAVMLDSPSILATMYPQVGQ